MTAEARATRRPLRTLAHARDLWDEAGWWTRGARERDRRAAKRAAHRAERQAGRVLARADATAAAACGWPAEPRLRGASTLGTLALVCAAAALVYVALLVRCAGCP